MGSWNEGVLRPQNGPQIKRMKLVLFVDPILEPFGLSFWAQNGVQNSKKGPGLGSLLGRLGIFLGSPMFQNTCRRFIKTYMFKIACSRYGSFLGQLLQAVLAPFGLLSAPEWNPQFHKNLTQKVPSV